jgi:putative ABC transport system permease protein
MWFRRGLSLAVLVLASLVVGGAVTGPLFLRSAGESVLRDTLAQSLPVGRIVSDQFNGTMQQLPLATVETVSAARLKRFPTLSRLLDPPVASLDLRAVVGSGVTADPTPFVYRAGVCAHVHMVQGLCPVGPGSVMVSANSAGLQRWSVGGPLLIDGIRVTIAGIYAPLDPTGDYWGGHPYFAAYSGSGMAGNPGGTLDAVFAPLETVQAQPAGIGAIGTVDRSLDLGRIRLTDVPSLKTELLGYSEGGFQISNNAMADVLQQATDIKDGLLSPVVVVMAQLLLLCWLILFLVTANAAEARGPEVALAKLRGMPAGRTVAFGLLDTLLLVAAAVPIGLGLGYLGVRVLADLYLTSGTPVVVTSGAWMAAAGAGAGAAVAAVLAGSRTLRRPVVEQWRRATRQAKARSWVIDTVVVAASVAALVALIRGGVIGSSGPKVLALVAPGLVVLAVALLGSRVLPVLCRAAYGPTRRRGRLGGFLAVRQLGRRPSTLRLALVLAVAFGLVAFGVDAWSVASSNSHDRAWTETGAAQVLTVNPAPGRDLEAIVDRLDPSGRDATVVRESIDFSNGPPVWLLAVQPDRFAHVAFWRSDFGQPPLATLTARLTQQVAPAVSLTGDALQVTLDASRLSAQGPPILVADFAQIGGGLTSTTLGQVRAGKQTLRAHLPCPTQGCRLIGLHLERPTATFFPISGRLVVTALGTRDQGGWHTTDANLALANGWRATGGGAKAPAATSGGLQLDMSAALADQPTWHVNDEPVSLPALMTTSLGGQDHAVGLDGSTLAVHPVATGPALPGGFGRVIIVDGTYAVRAAANAPTIATQTVWLTPAVAATFPAKLEKAGVTILSTQSAAQQSALYSRQGPMLAILLFLAGSFLGALLAAGGAVLNLHLTGRRRTYELAAMSALGVRRATLLASLFAEQGLLLVFGVVVGALAGLVGAVLALPSVPEFADQPSAPPMLYGLHTVPVLLAVSVAIVVLAVVVAASSVNLLRLSRFDQLREAPA